MSKCLVMESGWEKIGSIPYLLLYHAIALVNAIIMCLIFPDSVSVGASADIFGMIGIVCVMKWKKDASLLLGLESFVTHFVAFVFGVVVGLLLQKKSKGKWEIPICKGCKIWIWR